MKKKLIVLLATLALVAASCGDGGDAETETTETTEAAAVTTTTQVEEPSTDDEPMVEAATIRWMTRPDNPEEAAVYGGISDQISSSMDDTELVYEPGSNEGAGYQQTLLTNLSAGTAPDVFWIPGTDIADFASRDVILDLRQYADATGHNDADFYPGPMGHLTTDVASGQPGSSLWGLPRDVSTFALYINNDLIAEAGVDDPR